MLTWIAVALIGGATAGEGDAERGRALLVEHRCVACHSLDGSGSSGPGLAGLWGTTEQVKVGPERTELVVDEAYVRRALLEPDAEIVVGYTRGSMARYELDEEDVVDIVAALRVLERPTPPPPPSLPPFTGLVLASMSFVGAHLALSSSALRGPLVRGLGLVRFQLLYSCIVALALAWQIYAWSQAPVVTLWPQTWWSRWVPILGMPLVYMLFFESLITPSPTVAGQEKHLEREGVVRGVLKITRHPMLWSFALWGLVHLPPNGDVASVLLFGSIAFLALAGMAHIDLRRSAAHPDRWAIFAAQTSRFPFVALLRGRTALRRDDLRWPVLGLGLAAAVAMFFLHEWAIGVSAWPISWMNS